MQPWRLYQMNMFINKKSALGTAPNADSIHQNKLYFKARSKKIQLKYPKNASPLFCTFDQPIATRINKAGFCYLLRSSNYLTYDLTFSKGKEIWVLYFREYFRQLSINLSYELLRHGAIKVLIDWFPLEEHSHDE